ncbi:MAG: TlpA family protein disulfide reductase, partial [Planctomycetes bacterium]|nr:TlpA family protein disulfide reductase [Planctomycetota bacterium]
MFVRLAIACAALFTFVTPSAAQAAQKAEVQVTLKTGMPAPALSIEKWVKGSPVASFEKGKVYVVEFWATWCGPCIAGMPHLSSLQREYAAKNVTIIGVTSLDSRGNDLAAVEKMVADKGDGMAYTVAWDTARKTNEAYMKAAGQNGIPCCFLVDQTGTVAYIGHPMNLDLPLRQVVAGTWDIEKGNAMLTDVQSRMSAIYKQMRSEPAAALAKLDELVAKYPDVAANYESIRFDLLLATNDCKAAYKLGAKLVDAAIAHKDAAELNKLAWSIVDPEAKLAERDLDLALRAAQ